MPAKHIMRLRAALGGAVLIWGMVSHGAQAAQKLHFDLMEIRVEGSNVLPGDQVEAAVYPFLGPDKTLDDVEHARAALEALYQTAGFATVSVIIPRQHVSQSDGVVQLQVIERPVGRLRVTGARYFLPSDIKRGAPSVAPGKVPNTKEVTRDLAALDSWPDRQVQPLLRAGFLPDTVDVDLDVNDKFPLHGSLEVNNRYNADTTATRLAASLSYSNLFQRGDTVSIGYQVAPENVRDAEVSSASYLFHIPGSRLSLLFNYLHSNSNVVALGTTDVAGRGTAAGFRVLIPLTSNSNFSQSFSLGWDYKKFYELDTHLKTPSVPPGAAPITYYPLNAAYMANWTQTHSTTDLMIGMEFGLPAFGSSQPEFDNKTLRAPPGFSILRASVTREQDLPRGAQAWASFTGQLTNDPLVSSEQIAAGGADSVRGYLEAETLGDLGAYLQTELRSPSIAKYIGKPVDSWRFHLFYDAGVVNAADAELGQRSSYGLQSAGIGSRVNLWGYLNGVVQDAQTLNRGPDTKSGTNRVLFRVYGEF